MDKNKKTKKIRMVFSPREEFSISPLWFAWDDSYETRFPDKQNEYSKLPFDSAPKKTFRNLYNDSSFPLSLDTLSKASFGITSA